MHDNVLFRYLHMSSIKIINNLLFVQTLLKLQPYSVHSEKKVPSGNFRKSTGIEQESTGNSVHIQN